MYATSLYFSLCDLQSQVKDREGGTKVFTNLLETEKEQ